MKKLYISAIILLNCLTTNAQESFQLASPILRYASAFFQNEAKVDIVFAEPNTQIRYTLDGQTPTGQSPLYTQPLRITQNFTTVKARVFSAHFQASDIEEATFIKDGLPVQSIQHTTPSKEYQGSGPATLIDNQGGKTGTSGQTWLGFQVDTVEVVLELKKKEKVKQVLVNLLRDYGSWIFLPEKIEVFAFQEKRNAFQIVANQLFKQDKNIDGTACVPLRFDLKKGVKTNKIKVKLYLVKQLPSWHDGKGQKSWIFMDEVKVY